MVHTDADRPERRTALIVKEIDHYKINIAALSETRMAEEGQMTDAGSGYTFFWSGRTDERHESGVGFSVQTKLVKKLSNLPRGINEQLMVVNLPLSGKKQATFIKLTMTNPETSRTNSIKTCKS